MIAAALMYGICSRAADAGVDQAGVAVHGAGLSASDVDRDQRAHSAAGVIDRAGPAGGLSAGRAGRRDRRPGRRLVRVWLAGNHDSGQRVRHAAGRGSAPAGRLHRLGVDETAFLAASAYHSTSFVTGVVDLTGRVARLLEVVDGRSRKALCEWVSARNDAWASRSE